MMGYRARGFRELDRKLSRIARAFPKPVRKEINKAAAEEVLEEMLALVPVLSGRLRDSLAIIEGDAEIYVGPTRPGGSIAHLIEFGTIFMTAQPFIRPAFDNTQDRMLTVIGAGIIARIDEARRG